MLNSNIIKDLQMITNKYGKDGSITQEELCDKLVHHDLSSNEYNAVVEYLSAEGIVVESIDEEIKDSELKQIISTVKVDDPVKMYLKKSMTINIGTTIKSVNAIIKNTTGIKQVIKITLTIRSRTPISLNNTFITNFLLKNNYYFLTAFTKMLVNLLLSFLLYL